MSEAPLNIINYWKAVEEFTPSRIEEEKLTGNVRSIQREVLKDQDIPWLNHQYFEHRNSKTEVWSYTVFLGIVLIEDINKKIISRLSSEQFADRDVEGVSSICSFQVNINGQITPNSLKIADWFVAINSLKANKNIVDTENSKEKIANKIKDLIFNLDDKLNASGQRKKIDFNDLKILVENCLKLAGWQSLITQNLIKNSAVIYSSKIKIPLKREGEDTEDILDLESGIMNSYILSDLEYIASEIKDEPEALPVGLKQYLSNKQIQKINLYDNKESLQRFVSPVYLPLARWPNNGDHSLNLAQQMAVNLSFLDKEGLFSINGPPGTGKNTLLRDIIANVITNRAEVLATFKQVDQAFVKSEGFKYNGLSYKVWELDAKLYNHEIFVTSSNNAAVENISKEIPKLASIDPKWHIDYFANIANFVHNEPCWGLGAAILGNKKNRINYFNKFWSFKAQVTDNFCNMGLEEYLKLNKALPNWAKAREDFSTTYNACFELKAELIKLENIIQALPDLRVKKANFAEQQIELKANLQVLQKQIEAAEIIIKELNDHLNHLKWTMNGQILLKPSWLKRIWGVIFKIHHHGKWQADISATLEETNALQTKLISANEQKANLIKQHQNEQEVLAKQLLSTAALDLTIAEYEALLTEAKPQFGKYFPDAKLWELPKEQLQQILPWNYARLHQLRGELFSKALNLHQAFITNAAEKLMNNLRVMNLLMRSNGLPSEYNHLLKSVWASFFMVVPVVSSTFSSFANLCSGLGKDSIGWALIDEAGQAAPQSAIGVLWRAKRIIVVGDPMQIKPVVTIANNLDEAFRKFYGVSKIWSPTNESLQTISDRNNK